MFTFATSTGRDLKFVPTQNEYHEINQNTVIDVVE